MRSLPFLALLTLPALAQPAAPGAPGASLQNLVANSPFGAANTAAPGAPAAATPLEFRGTFVDGGERFFSILDASSRRAEWVSLNETGRPFVVKSYDPSKEAITVEFQGRALELKLRDARVVSAPLPQPAQPAVVTAAAPAQPGAPAAAPAAVPSATEAQRLAQVAEEIRRRRALRQQAQGGPPPNTAPPPNTPPKK